VILTILETLLNHSIRLQVKGSSPVSLATTLNARAMIPNRPLPFSFLSSNELLKERKKRLGSFLFRYFNIKFSPSQMLDSCQNALALRMLQCIWDEMLITKFFISTSSSARQILPFRIRHQTTLIQLSFKMQSLWEGCYLQAKCPYLYWLTSSLACKLNEKPVIC